VMERWYPDEKIRKFIVEYGHEVMGVFPVDLYDDSKFYCAPWFWLKAITLHEDFILVDDDLYNSKNIYLQTLILHHELIHVGQQKTMPRGLVGFYVTYSSEWIRSGFSYKNMKKIGLEAEAIRETNIFKQALYKGEKVDAFYTTRTNDMYNEWIRKEAFRKVKRVRLGYGKTRRVKK